MALFSTMEGSNERYSFPSNLRRRVSKLPRADIRLSARSDSANAVGRVAGYRLTTVRHQDQGRSPQPCYSKVSLYSSFSKRG